MSNEKYRFVDFGAAVPMDTGVEINVSIIDSVDGSRKRGIGIIKWYAKIRAFCFFPIGGAAIPTRCLKEILAYMNERIDEYADVVMREENSNGQ